MKFITLVVAATLAVSQGIMVNLCRYDRTGCRGFSECGSDERTPGECYVDEFDSSRFYTMHQEGDKLCKVSYRDSSCSGRGRKRCGTIGRCLPDLDGPGSIRFSVGY